MLKLKDGERIVFAGDSVTDAGRKRPVGDGLWEGVGNGYVRCVETLLNVCYPESLFHVVNMGVSGNTSRDLLARWQSDVLDLAPDWVVLCIGFNDVWRWFDSPSLPGQVTEEEYRSNLEEMIRATLPGVKGLVLMTPYYMETITADARRARMDVYGGIVKETAAKFGLPCVDLQKEMCDYLQYRHSAYLMWDRVHPGWVGSMLIARAFLREMGFDRPVI